METGNGINVDFAEQLGKTFLWKKKAAVPMRFSLTTHYLTLIKPS